MLRNKIKKREGKGKKTKEEGEREESWIKKYEKKWNQSEHTQNKSHGQEREGNTTLVMFFLFSFCFYWEPNENERDERERLRKTCPKGLGEKEWAPWKKHMQDQSTNTCLEHSTDREREKNIGCNPAQSVDGCYCLLPVCM